MKIRGPIRDKMAGQANSVKSCCPFFEPDLTLREAETRVVASASIGRDLPKADIERALDRKNFAPATEIDAGFI